VEFGFPGILSTGVAFPRDQVLPSAGRSSVGVNGFNLILFFPINELARLRNEVGAKFRSFGVGGEE